MAPGQKAALEQRQGVSAPGTEGGGAKLSWEDVVGRCFSFCLCFAPSNSIFNWEQIKLIFP